MPHNSPWSEQHLQNACFEWSFSCGKHQNKSTITGTTTNSSISGKIMNTVNAKNNTNRIIEHENAIEWRASNSSPLYFIALCRVIPIPHSVGIVQKHQYRSDSLASFGWCETKHARIEWTDSVSSCCCCVLKVLEPSDNDKSLIRSYSAAPAAYARFTGWFEPGCFFSMLRVFHWIHRLNGFFVCTTFPSTLTNWIKSTFLIYFISTSLLFSITQLVLFHGINKTSQKKIVSFFHRYWSRPFFLCSSLIGAASRHVIQIFDVSGSIKSSSQTIFTIYLD